jgi:Mu transposase-like protein
MLALPPVAPAVGLRARVRLARDYYVRVDTCDYSVDPRVIGRFVDVAASPTEVAVRCGGELVASHARSWARRAVVTDPAHVEIARLLRREHAARRDADARLARRHGDGHAVMLRALPDYDALFGVDFTPTPAQGELPGAVDSEATPS